MPMTERLLAEVQVLPHVQFMLGLTSVFVEIFPFVNHTPLCAVAGSGPSVLSRA
jgi:hypothetical protein